MLANIGLINPTTLSTYADLYNIYSMLSLFLLGYFLSKEATSNFAGHFW